VAAWRGFTILCTCRPGLPVLAGFGFLVIGLENGDCWVSSSTVSAEPVASTNIHLSNRPVTFSYPQLPPVLRTFAVPPLGVQCGAAVSLPEAMRRIEVERRNRNWHR
jgi:hypothetical protein